MSLRRGDIINFGGQAHIVTYVNECRAHVVPAARRVRVVTPKTGPNAGKRITFRERQPGFDISPHSDVEVLP